MRAVIVAGGKVTDIEFYKKYITPYDSVICADSGLDHALAMGIMPQVIIGDMDSVKSAIPHQVAVISHPKDKDQTDTRLAIDYALKAGFKEIHLLCALGGRFDHSIANVYELLYIQERGGKGIIVNEKNEVQLAVGPGMVTMEGEKGQKVSLIAFIGEVAGISTFGMKYSMYEAVLWLGSDRGVSNEFLGGAAGVSVKSGMLLVIKSIED